MVTIKDFFVTFPIAAVSWMQFWNNLFSLLVTPMFTLDFPLLIWFIVITSMIAIFVAYGYYYINHEDCDHSSSPSPSEIRSEGKLQPEE